mgnify:CR=1 FL=1|jgi:hypothetical protein
MTKTGIRLIYRSKETVEFSPGEYNYQYSVSPMVLAKISSKTFTEEDKSTINQNLKSELKFDILLPNDSTDRINRISHILYMGTLYKVATIRPYPPRVVITLDDIELSDIKTQLDKLIEDTVYRDSNEIKIKAYDSLNVIIPKDDTIIKKGDIVLRDSVLHVYTGSEYLSLLDFISKKLGDE